MRAVFYVYILFREDGSPFYVGKGKGDRSRKHLREMDGRNKHKCRISAQVIAALGDIPCVHVASNMTEADAFALERLMIATIGRFPDGPLVNLTDGGDGISGFRYTPEQRAAMSAARKGMKRSEEICKRMSDAQKGKKSPHLCERNRSPEHRAKLSDANRRRNSMAALRAGMSPETLRAKNKKIREDLGYERRCEIAQKVADSKTREEHSERVRRANASQTPEQRHARGLKAGETMKRNRLLKLQALTETVQ